MEYGYCRSMALVYREKPLPSYMDYGYCRSMDYGIVVLWATGIVDILTKVTVTDTPSPFPPVIIGCAKIDLQIPSWWNRNFWTLAGGLLIGGPLAGGGF